MFADFGGLRWERWLLIPNGIGMICETIYLLESIQERSEALAELS